jgi:hypothetical protein
MNPRHGSTVLMVEPAHFGSNPETSASNAFQQSGQSDPDVVQQEFDGVVAALRAAGVRVDVIPGNHDIPTPDEVFPNNWVSFHRDVTVLYPMLVESRRRERRIADLERLYPGRQTIDLSDLEQDGHILEGTGSLVLDPKIKSAFASLSPRTTHEALEAWSARLCIGTHSFRSEHRGSPIYHTNVLLAIGETAVVWCPDVVSSVDRDNLRIALESPGRPVIDITVEQMEAFCANTLELRGDDGQPFWAMSTCAHDALTPEQRRQLGRIVHAPIPTIERLGGGSVRCMLCQVD